MRIEPLAIDGVLLITLDRYSDDRGYSSERYHREKWAELGFNADFIQDNYSRSTPGVLRGIHVQYQPQQGKLVGVTQGAIYDVAVDLRLDSRKLQGTMWQSNSAKNNVSYSGFQRDSDMDSAYWEIAQPTLPIKSLARITRKANLACVLMILI